LSPPARLSVSLAPSFDSLLPRTPDSLQLRTTRESDEAIVSAIVTVHAQEAVGEHATLQIRAKLSLDESHYGGTLLACARKERLEVIADDLVEQCAFRLAPVILDGVAPARDRGSRRGTARKVPGPRQWPDESGWPSPRRARLSRLLSSLLAPQAGLEASMRCCCGSPLS